MSWSAKPLPAHYYLDFRMQSHIMSGLMTAGTKCDLLLVNLGNRTQAYQSLASELTAIEPPVWAGLIASYVRNKGHSVEVLDANAEEMTPEQAAGRVAETKPTLTTVVVYGHNPSASTQVMPAVAKFCETLKVLAPNLKILLVGGHVAAMPRQTMMEEACDFVCDGEGPVTTLELLTALKTKPVDPAKVRGLWYRENDQLKTTAHAPLVENLDQDMGEIAWDLLPMQKYRAHNWHCFGGKARKPYASLYTSLGCPYNCTFCCIHAPFKTGETALGYSQKTNSYRLWSPESVVRQIDTLVSRYGISNIKFADELFVLNRKHVEGICDLIIAHGHKLNIWAYARVDTVRDPGLLAKMKLAGINWVALGIESGSNRVLKDAGKRTTRDDTFHSVKLIEAAGINIIGNYLFGLPEDDQESMTETLNLAKELNCEFANIYCAMAYPGSELYEQAKREKWPLPASWVGYSQYAADMLPLPTRHLRSEEVLRFRDLAFQDYFSNPRYLDMIRGKFGIETVDEIRNMLGRKLDRQHA